MHSRRDRGRCTCGAELETGYCVRCERLYPVFRWGFYYLDLDDMGKIPSIHAKEGFDLSFEGSVRKLSELLPF